MPGLASGPYLSVNWCIQVFLSLFLVLSFGTKRGDAATNVSLPLSSSALEYTPAVCNASIATTLDTPPGCGGLWYDALLPGTPLSTVRRTEGPSANESGILPQLFLSVRASAVYVLTSMLSTATINVTVSGAPPASARAAGGGFAALNLPPGQTTTVVLTYVPPGRLDISEIEVTVDDASASSSFLPTPTLPPSSTLPSLSPTSPPSSSNSGLSFNARLGLGLGLGLGSALVILLMLALAWAWRRRRRRKEEEDLWIERRDTGREKGKGRAVSSTA